VSDWAEAAGRTLMVGVPGTDLDQPTARRLRDLAPGGLILFHRNLDSPVQTAGLIRDLLELLPGPSLVALDQEGGRVSRLEPWIGETPTAEVLGRLGETAVSRFAAATADALRGLGFNVDFAPVTDLCSADASNGIADRSFGTDPRVVSRLAGSFLDALQEQGVAGCLKHFPGLGCTSVDSHHELPVVRRTGAQLEAEELRPYRDLGSRAAAVMVGHGHYAEWDVPGQPASGSKRIVQGLLRDRLGYRGLVVSDDLEMGAVAELDADGEFAVRAVAAGCDLILYCSDLERAERARSALERAAATDPIFGQRLRSAADSVSRTASQWPAPAPDLELWERARHELSGFAG